MFSAGPSYDKLKTNLRLSMSRLKLAQKKKAELGQKSRKEIADFLAMGKADRARIRVEHIIREDYYCEAMEMIEMYCDLILARFGLVKECQTLDSGLQESVSSIIWAGPRIATDVPEMKNVCDQLARKYGEMYIRSVRENSIDTVNTKLMHRLSADPPPRHLVESYLKEIAAAHGLTYEPQIVDDKDHKGDGGVGELIDISGGSQQPDPSTAVGFRPDLMRPEAAPKAVRIGPAFEPPMPEVHFPLPPPPPGAPYTQPVPPPGPGQYVPPPLPTSGPAADDSQSPSASGSHPPKQDTPFKPYSEDMPPPTYDAAITMNRGGTVGFPPDMSNVDFPEIPDLPDVPRSDAGTPRGDPREGGGSGGDVDFDELSRRFEELKRRK